MDIKFDVIIIIYSQTNAKYGLSNQVLFMENVLRKPENINLYVMYMAEYKIPQRIVYFFVQLLIVVSYISCDQW